MVCPLNWGLGHASRMIPVIISLINDGHEVILGGDGDALALLKDAFPQLESIHIKDIQVKFPHDWMLVNLLLLIPKITYNTLTENYLLKKIIKQKSIDIVISDNRYGLWNKKITSILVTHQLMVKLPFPFHFLEYVTYLIIKQAIGFFDYCWVPDYKDNENSLSGDLSKKYPIHPTVKFIGPLSRFNNLNEKPMSYHYNVIVILSGPEPSKSVLENKLTSILIGTHFTCLFIQGNPQKKVKYSQKENVTFVSHLPSDEFKYFLKKADQIICRSGYTSIMELNQLQLNAILIPTPGQTEQEYLANHVHHKFLTINQEDLSKKTLINLFQRKIDFLL